MYNNAAILGAAHHTEDIPEEHWDEIQSINLKGVWPGMKYTIPEMLKRGKGSIINTASQCGGRGTCYLSACCAAKGVMLALTRVTAME